MSPRILFGGKKDEEGAGSFRRAAEYLSLGGQLAAAVVGFGLIGYWLDSSFHTGELYTTILLFVGAIGGLYSFIKTVIALGKKDKEEDSAGKDKTGKNKDDEH
jgi:F0F1-type ATP synthase assembly protein I